MTHRPSSRVAAKALIALVESGRTRESTALINSWTAEFRSQVSTALSRELGEQSRALELIRSRTRSTRAVIERLKNTTK